ncbi:MAG: TetR/AcrR family transcriptional regulator [Solirubrobacteraceae bacterium]
MSKSSGTPTSGERLARADRERLMLSAAGQAFATHGFHRSSMDEIANAAGITKPMLYRYFGSKEGLYAAYLRMTGHELVERVRAADTHGQPPPVRLRAGLRAFLTYVEEHRAGWTVLHGETTAPTDAQVAREVAKLRGRIVGMLTTLFANEPFAHAFTGAAESLATWWVSQPQPSIDEATAILMSIAEAATTFDRAA